MRCRTKPLQSIVLLHEIEAMDDTRSKLTLGFQNAISRAWLNAAAGLSRVQAHASEVAALGAYPDSASASVDDEVVPWSSLCKRVLVVLVTHTTVLLGRMWMMRKVIGLSRSPCWSVVPCAFFWWPVSLCLCRSASVVGAQDLKMISMTNKTLVAPQRPLG